MSKPAVDLKYLKGFVEAAKIQARSSNRAACCRSFIIKCLTFKPHLLIF